MYCCAILFGKNATKFNTLMFKAAETVNQTVSVTPSLNLHFGTSNVATLQGGRYPEAICMRRFPLVGLSHVIAGLMTRGFRGWRLQY